ncbi:MAG: FliM/FliN family flagellar motor switch protein [Candidatus Omnitrophica bacterium]|nr:FliM/FliN family flagellar motor switch protein [Candidatus Omnitrophota bacterium]
MDEPLMRKEETDSFAEICNIAFGAPANELTGRLHGQVKFAPPKVTIVEAAEAVAATEEKSVVLRFSFSGDYRGEWFFAMDVGTAEQIATRMVEKKVIFVPPTHAAEGKQAILVMMQEITRMGEDVLTKSIRKTIKFDAGSITLGEPTDFAGLFPEGIVKVLFRFKVADMVDSTLLSFVSIPFARAAVADFEQAIMNQMEGFDEVAAQPTEEPEKKDRLQTIAEYCRRYGDFDTVAKIKVPVAVQLARQKMTLRQLWTAGRRGLVLKFDATIREPVAVAFGRRILARAEIVTIAEHFGAKITEVGK